MLRLPVLLISAAGLLTLASCGRPKAPKPTPAAPAAGARAPESSSQQQQDQAAKAQQLQENVSAAAELFNRGENDLACDQVAKAAALRAAAASASPPAVPPAVINDLQRFQQACGPG